MTVRSKIDGWVGWSGGEVLLAPGNEYADDHPLVQERPEWFTEPARQSRAAEKKAARRAASE